MQRAGACLPPHIPDSRLQAPQDEQQRQPWEDQRQPQQESDFSLFSHAFGAKSRPQPSPNTTLPNPAWMFSSSSNWRDSGLQTPSHHSTLFRAHTPSGGSPIPYMPSRPNSPYPAWMAPPPSGAFANAGTQTPAFGGAHTPGFVGGQTPGFVANYDDSWHMPPSPTLPVCFFLRLRCTADRQLRFSAAKLPCSYQVLGTQRPFSPR
jgi:hypothetical protein